jgi:hypothetical protein
MSRKLRIEYPVKMYHVMNHEDQPEDVFRDDEDRQRFLFRLVHKLRSSCCCATSNLCDICEPATRLDFGALSAYT